MAQLEVFDPPMCCSTGVCGPSVDPILPQFAADLEWLRSQGVTVERFNLSQQPGAFAGNESVKKALAESGNNCLPLILVDGRIVSQGVYPTRQALAAFVGGDNQQTVSIYSPAVAELVALGAAIAANCEGCFKYHFAQAKKLGVSRADMALVVRTAQGVKDAPAQALWEMAGRYLGCAMPTDGNACESGSASAAGTGSGTTRCC